MVRDFCEIAEKVSRGSRRATHIELAGVIDLRYNYEELLAETKHLVLCPGRLAELERNNVASALCIGTPEPHSLREQMNQDPLM